MDYLERLQRKLQPKYNKQQKQREAYKEAKSALFERRTSDEITLQEYLAALEKLQVKYGIHGN